MRPSESQGLQIDAPTSTPAAGFGDAEEARTVSLTAMMNNASATPAPSGAPPTQPATFMSEEQYLAESFKEDHTVPIVVLALGALTAIGLTALSGADGGVAVALTAAIGAVVKLGFGVLVATAVGWIVGRMFDTDHGTVPLMLLRFGAVTAGCQAAAAVMWAVMGPFGWFFGLPVLLVLAVWLTAMDFFQAMVFAVILGVANILMLALLVGSLGAMMMG